MKGYNQQYKNAKKDLAKLVSTIEKVATAARDAVDDDSAEETTHAVVVTAIKNETNKNNITQFAAMVDNIYKQRMESCVDWSVATSYLLSDGDIMALYTRFQQQFPLIHMTLSAIVSTRYYSLPLSAFTVDDCDDSGEE
jgi:predicted ATPase